MTAGSGSGAAAARSVGALAVVVVLAGGALYGGCSRSSERAALAAATPSGPGSASSRSTSPDSVPSAVVPSVPVAVLPSGRAGVPGGGLPDPARVNNGDPDAVGRAVLTALWSWDTALDVTLADAERRAAPWLTPEYAAAVTSRVSVAGPGARWTEWAAHRAYARVSGIELLLDERPPEGPAAAYRQWRITTVPTGRDGWAGPPVVAIAFVELVRVGGAWRVAGVRVS